MKTSITVFLKEVRENIRDRRTVMNTLLTGPLMAPLIFVLLINGIVSRELEKAEKPLPVPVIGAAHAPNLIDALKQSGIIVKDPLPDPERAVRDQEADLVLRIPDTYAEAWSKGEPAQVELIYDESQRDAQGSVSRLRRILDGYGQRTSTLRVVARGLSPTILRPLVVADRDQSTAQARGGMMFSMLPYFFILGAFIGGMALAIDTTAGERERQSLEPLFANPVARSRILLGKLGATSAFALTTLLLSIIAFSFAGQFMPTEKLGMTLSIGPHFALLTLLAMLPLVFLIASLQTLAAAFAKTFREAQTYLSLLMFVPAVPTMLMSLFPFKVETWMYAVPLVGQQITITRLMRGEIVSAGSVGLCFLCTSIAAVLVYFLTARIYQGERLAIST
ncbi:ABC transporter permease [Dokdonella immobilis]|uniref:Sodium transport system permease protein n=1 Tax=Dokdonella immobilis TaxID=578942 RepID=A0A1I5AYQ5_9GAMM|nr:ABC transporter permease [Dokdonella immobilis]SFN67585.1 sodium transport system permease protein [Dokdonella immobilis]